MKLKNLKKNKGFTLVELLVAFAIFGIISVALVGFLTMSSRSYRRTSAIVSLQIEYQVTMSMVSEYIIDCNAGLAFDEAQNALYIVSYEDSGYVTYVFRFDAAENTLFFGEFTGNQAVNPANADAHVSRNIQDFSVSLDGGNMIAVTMSFSVLDRPPYNITQFTALRNTPVWGSSYAEIVEVLFPDDE